MAGSEKEMQDETLHIEGKSEDLMGQSCPSMPDLARDNEELRQHVAHLDTRIASIQEIGLALGSTLDLDDLLNIIMEKITVVMEADRSTLFLFDEERSALWSKVMLGDQVNEIRLEVGEGIAGWVAQTGQSINIRDAYHDNRFNSDVDIRTGYHTSSVLCQPLRNHDRDIIGVVQVLNKVSGPHFTETDENLLSAIASQATIVIENSRLYLSAIDRNLELIETKEKLEQKIAELDLLYDIQSEISQALDLSDLIRTVASKALKTIHAELCAVAIREKDHLRVFSLERPLTRSTEFPVLTVMDTTRMTLSGDLQVRSEPVEDGVCAFVINSGVPLVANDLNEFSHRIRGAEIYNGVVPRNVLTVPFFADERCIGALCLVNKVSEDYGSGFDDNDVKVLTVLAGQIAGPVSATLFREKQEKANRLATIGQMLSGVIHDFKTPVTIISGYVQLMARQNDPTVRKEYAEAVLKQFDQLNNMTKEILAFARGESTILLRKVFLHKFTDELRELLVRDLEERRVHLTIETSYRGAVKMDDVKLKRAIFNLARNAADAMPKGGDFSVNIWKEDDWVHFEFKDSGQGIPEEIRGSLFESFVTRGKRDGTGLGLAIVKKIVEEHRGTISFESELGVGTTFLIRLPVEQD